MATNFKQKKTYFKLSWKLIYTFVSLIIVVNCTNPQKLTPQNTDWEFQSQREEIKPKHWFEENIRYNGEPTLALAGNGNEHANGSWTKTYEVTPG